MTEDDGVTFRQYSYDNLNQLKTELFYDKVSGVGEYKWYSVSSSGNVAFIAFNYNNGMYTTSYSSGQGYGSGTDWKELMTSFGGTPITYDANGTQRSMNLLNMAESDEQTAADLADQAVQSGRSSAFLQDYLYLIEYAKVFALVLHDGCHYVDVLLGAHRCRGISGRRPAPRRAGRGGGRL